MDNIQLAAYLKDEVSPTLSNISKHIDKMEKEFQKAGTTSERAGKKIKQSSNTAADAVNNWAKGLAVGAVAMQAFNVASDAVVQAGKWEKFSKALASMEGGVTAGNKAMERLIELSKMPGLGLEEVNKAYLGLRAVGMQAGESERTIRAFGNAIANAGGGAEEFERVQRQITQMLSKGRVLQEDVSIISESMPNISKLMQEAFGTSSVENIRKMGVGADEFVKKIVMMAEKMPQATSGINDAMDDLNTSWSRFKAGFVNTEWMKGALNATSDFLSRLTKIMEDSNTKINKMELFKAFMTGGIGGAAGVIAGGGGTTDVSDKGRLMTAMQEREEKIKRAKYYADKNHTESKKLYEKLTKEQSIDYRNYRRLVDQQRAADAKIAEGAGTSGSAGTGDATGTGKGKGIAGVATSINLSDSQLQGYKEQWNEKMFKDKAGTIQEDFDAELEMLRQVAKRENNSMMNNRIKLQTEREAEIIAAEERWTTAKDQFIQGIAGGMEGVFSSAFQNIGAEGHNLFSDLLEGFKAMLIQMAAEMAAKAVVFGLFNMFTGGTGAAGVGVAGGFLKTILGASAGPAPSLAPTASASAGVNLTVNLSGGATKRDAVTIANTLAAAQRGRLVGAMA